jgi:hypothetical protein
MSVAKWVIVGELERDVILRHTPSGKKVCDVRVRVPGERGKDVIHELSLWDDLAESFCRDARRGTIYEFRGVIGKRSVESKDRAGKDFTLWVPSLNVRDVKPHRVAGGGAPAAPARREYGAKPAYKTPEGDFHEPNEPDSDCPF